MAAGLRTLRLFAVLAAVIVATIVPGTAAAGQARAPQRSPIPGRLLKLREGDWSVVRTSEGLMKETVTGIEETEADPENNIEPYYMVNYRIERFDGATGKAAGEPMDVARALEHEVEENAAALQGLAGRPERRRATIAGKTMNVVVLKREEEEGIIIEEWYSDEAGIDGRVAIIVSGKDVEPYSALEIVAFGNARTSFDINRLLRK